MPYELRITPENERASLIESQLKHSREEYSTFDIYPSKEIKLQVISLPLEVPIYRLSNGRTYAEQLQILEEEKLNEDYFRTGQENEDAQNRQHEILAVMADQSADGEGDSILKVLKKSQQTEPILISPSGVVLNGNRRLAAMRELLDSNPAEYARYSVVRCAVLPSLTEQQELDIELKLQMSQNFKLEYNWMNEAMMIQSAKRYHNLDELQQMTNKSKQHLVMLTRAFDEARLYLQNKSGKEASFKLVQEKFQLFKDLQRFTKDKSPDEAESIRRIAWVLADSNNLEDRLYSYNFIFSTKVEDFVDKIISGNRLESEIRNESNPKPTLTLGQQQDSKFDLFNKWILQQGGSDSARVKEVIERHAEMFNDAENSRKNSENPLKLVTEIHTKIQNLSVVSASPESTLPITEQLKGIREKATELLRILHPSDD